MLLCFESIHNGIIESTDHTHRQICIFLFHTNRSHISLKSVLPVTGIAVLNCVIEVVLFVTVTNEKSVNHVVKIDQQTIIDYIRNQLKKQ